MRWTGTRPDAPSRHRSRPCSDGRARLWGRLQAWRRRFATFGNLLFASCARSVYGPSPSDGTRRKETPDGTIELSHQSDHDTARIDFR
jgi:hypothetical protein